jgi:ADP-ribosylglycohydrolase
MPHDPVVGCILGTAVGDALGLPYEGLSPRRAAQLLGPPDCYRLLGRRGMVSDDTEHTCMVAQALIASSGQTEAFQRELSRRFRFWLLSMPAGIGFATLRAILRLWIGYGPGNSGVYSAGNGPAMRAAILGAALDERQTLRHCVAASTRITHTDPKAEYGALAVALAAQMARRGAPVVPEHYSDELQSMLPGDARELVKLVDAAAESAKAGETTQAFADSLGLARGVSGYVYHSVPVALHAWLANQHNFGAAVMSVIRCGGDADSTGAIVGGIVGAAVGKNGIPTEWLSGLREWPRTVQWMESLGSQLESSAEVAAPRRPPELPRFSSLPRNFFFLSVVLFHGFRRLFPPY